MLDFLGLRALPGVESLDGATYRRSLRLPHGHAVVALTAAAAQGDAGPAFVEGELRLSDLRDLTTAVSRAASSSTSTPTPWRCGRPWAVTR